MVGARKRDEVGALDGGSHLLRALVGHALVVPGIQHHVEHWMVRAWSRTSNGGELLEEPHGVLRCGGAALKVVKGDPVFQ
jgi:hypothetical protein